MKQICSFLLICGALFALSSCGGDDAGSNEPKQGTTQGQPSTPSVQFPTLDESSITCDFKERIIYFHGECPIGTSFKVHLSAQDETIEDQLVEVGYRNVSKLYYISLAKLQPGMTYTFYIIGYDSKGNEALRSAEQTFSMPKNASPKAPSVYNVNTYAPTSIHGTDGYAEGAVITLEMEYSTDNGQSWQPVVEAGYIRNVPTGKVLLRLAETATTEAGLSAELTIPAYKSNADPDGDDGTSEGMRVRHV